MNPLTRLKLFEKLFIVFGFLVAFFVFLVLLALIFDLIKSGWGRLNWQFLFSFPSRFPEKAGVLSAGVGSILIMLLTTLMAVPLGVMTGVCLEEYAPKNKWTLLVEMNIANLAGVPSIVYGLMALGLLVYKLHLGQSLITAGITLSLLILPIVIMTTREAIRTVPVSLREAAYSMGITRWQCVRDHVLPYARGGILTGVIMGLSRAIGETAPLLTIGALTFIAFLPEPFLLETFPFFTFDWIHSPYTVMPIQMFNWISRPQTSFHSNAAAAGLVLLAITLGMNLFAIILRYKFRRHLV